MVETDKKRANALFLSFMVITMNSYNYKAAYSYLVARCCDTCYIQPTKAGFLLLTKGEKHYIESYYLQGSKLMCWDRQSHFVYADLA